MAARMASSFLRCADRANSRLRGIRHRDEQHHDGGADQDQDRCACIVAEVAVAVRSILKFELRGKQIARGLRVHVQGGCLQLQDSAIHAVERIARLLDRVSRFAARDEIEPVIVITIGSVPSGSEQRLGRERDEDIGLVAEGDSVESPRGNANDGEDMAVDANGLIKRIRLRAEGAGPVVVAEHRHRIAGAGNIVRRRQDSSESRAARQAGKSSGRRRPWRRHEWSDCERRSWRGVYETRQWQRGLQGAVRARGKPGS